MTEEEWQPRGDRASWEGEPGSAERLLSAGHVHMGEERAESMPSEALKTQGPDTDSRKSPRLRPAQECDLINNRETAGSGLQTGRGNPAVTLGPTPIPSLKGAWTRPHSHPPPSAPTKDTQEKALLFYWIVRDSPQSDQ